MENEIPEFMIAVKNGMTYHFGFIKIDHDRVGRDNKFYFDVIKNSFPTRDVVNIMIMKYRQESEKTLYTAKSSEELQEVFNKRRDLIFGMIFEDTWREMYRTEEIKDEE